VLDVAGVTIWHYSHKFVNKIHEKYDMIQCDDLVYTVSIKRETLVKKKKKFQGKNIFPTLLLVNTRHCPLIL